MASILTAEAHVRRTSGLVVARLEGHGGGHQDRAGDEQSISQRVNPLLPWSKTFWGWPIVSNANPRSEQSGHRNALSPTKWVSPGQRAGIRSCIRHTSRSQRHPANAGQAERQADDQTAQDQGLIVGRAVVPSEGGMPKGMGEVSLA